MQTDYLDCCEQPTLKVMRTLSAANHDLEALLRCARCQAPWFYRFHEHPGLDDLTSWFTRLNDEEAERIRAAENPTTLDLGFLETRPSWMHDGRGPPAGAWPAEPSLGLTAACPSPDQTWIECLRIWQSGARDEAAC